MLILDLAMKIDLKEERVEVTIYQIFLLLKCDDKMNLCLSALLETVRSFYQYVSLMEESTWSQCRVV